MVAPGRHEGSKTGFITFGANTGFLLDIILGGFHSYTPFMYRRFRSAPSAYMRGWNDPTPAKTVSP